MMSQKHHYFKICYLIYHNTQRHGTHTQRTHTRSMVFAIKASSVLQLFLSSFKFDSGWKLTMLGSDNICCRTRNNILCWISWWECVEGILPVLQRKQICKSSNTISSHAVVVICAVSLYLWWVVTILWFVG